MAAQQKLIPDPQGDERDALVRRWFELTREQLPAAAPSRDWPVRFDHCFQRILLDNACKGRWTDTIERPAYAHAPDTILRAAIAKGERVLADEADLWALDANSLLWRGKPLKGKARMRAGAANG